SGPAAGGPPSPSTGTAVAAPAPLPPTPPSRPPFDSSRSRGPRATSAPKRWISPSAMIAAFTSPSPVGRRRQALAARAPQGGPHGPPGRPPPAAPLPPTYSSP